MEMDKNETGRVVTFKDLWNLFVQTFMIIAAVALAGTVLFFAAMRITYDPRYESTATLYILRQSESTSSGDASNEFSLALKLVNDCTYFLKSHVVLDQVIEDLDLNMTYKQLYNSVSTHNPDNTRILEITVEANSPEQAKLIVDQICQIAPEVIEEAMGYEQVHLFENGILNTVPSNQTGILVYMLIFVMLAVLTYGGFLIGYLLDDRLRTDEDVEKILGVSILGNIPDANTPHQDGYGYYAYGHHSSGGNKQRRG